MADYRTLKMALLADTSKFTSGLSKAMKSTDSFGSKVKNVAKGIGLAFAGMAVAAAGFAVKIGIDSVMAASNFEEALNKVNVVFGKGGKDIEAWSKTASKTFGQSQTQALDAASTFAVFGKFLSEASEFSTGQTSRLTKHSERRGSI